MPRRIISPRPVHWHDRFEVPFSVWLCDRIIEDGDELAGLTVYRSRRLYLAAHPYDGRKPWTFDDVLDTLAHEVGHALARHAPVAKCHRSAEEAVVTAQESGIRALIIAAGPLPRLPDEYSYLEED